MAHSHAMRSCAVPSRSILLAVLLVASSRCTHCWRLAAPKPCPEGCLDNGNCNHELGVCECNFGWAGPACTEAVLGACRSSGSRTALVMYGTAWPKSCQCWRQLLNQSLQFSHISAPRSEWLGYGQPGFEVAMALGEIHPSVLSNWVKYCYEREGVPPEEQYSEVPLAAEPGVKYLSPGNNFQPTERPEQIQSSADGRALLPLRMCPDRCHDRGACLAPSGVQKNRNLHATATAQNASHHWQVRHDRSERPDHQIGSEPTRLSGRNRSLLGVLDAMRQWLAGSAPAAVAASGRPATPPAAGGGIGSSADGRSSGTSAQASAKEAVSSSVSITATVMAAGVAGDVVRGATCLCRKGFMGPSCGSADNRAGHVQGREAGDKACLNRCSGMGQCLAGFCKCAAGRWGLDCSRSKVFEPDDSKQSEQHSSTQARSALRIYRYELPWQVTFPYELTDGWASYDHMYSAFERFFETLSGNWAVRTENPWEANLFYVPFLPMYRYSRWRPHHQVWHMMQYIREQYPALWSRHQGRDHFLWMTGDLGACHLLDVPLVQAPIKVVHFGLQVPLNKHTRMPGALFARSAQPVRAPERYSCHLSTKDVVSPPNDVANNSFEYLDERHWQQALDPDAPPRKHLLYFGGSLRLGDKEYSGGARQAFKRWVLDRNHSGVQYGGDLQSYRDSVFCFCPYGDGWGNRLPHIVLAGCVPVIMQDHVYQPFHDLLPYQEFSLTLSISQMPHLLSLLEAIPTQQVLQYRRSLYRHRHAFYWYGNGLAYNMTLRSLWKRRYQMWGEPG